MQDVGGGEGVDGRGDPRGAGSELGSPVPQLGESHRRRHPGAPEPEGASTLLQRPRPASPQPARAPWGGLEMGMRLGAPGAATPARPPARREGCGGAGLVPPLPTRLPACPPALPARAHLGPTAPSSAAAPHACAGHPQAQPGSSPEPPNPPRGRHGRPGLKSRLEVMLGRERGARGEGQGRARVGGSWEPLSHPSPVSQPPPDWIGSPLSPGRSSVSNSRYWGPG